MTTPISFPHRAPTHRLRWLGVIGAAAALIGVLHLPGGRPADAGELAAAPTPDSRAAYWLDRIIRGPEPTAFAIPNLHKDLLLDAERNLATIPGATLLRLADPELQRRVQSQDDANPWHAILSVLVRIGATRPEVARAWAGPALHHDLLTLRRAGVEVFESLKSPIDGPLLLEALERDAVDRLVGPRIAVILLQLGAPWDGAAARTLFARAPADGPRMSSGLWADLPSIASEASGGARPDLLAWWAFLTETAGPRRSDPTPTSNGRGRSIDPKVLAVVAIPHALTSGARAAASARLELSRRGSDTARRFSAADRTSPDPDVRDVSRVIDERPVTDAEREAIRARASQQVTMLGGPRPPTPTDVATVARALRGDQSPDALALLLALFRAIPVDPDWKVAHLDLFDGLVVRGGPLDAEIYRLLTSGTELGVDLALFLIQRSGGSTFIKVLEAWIETPAAAPHRLRVRRVLAFLYSGIFQHDGLDLETTARLARTVRTWVEDSNDPSATGLVAVLADLGPPGEAQIADGLRGERRELYVEGLISGGDHYVGSDVCVALVHPVDRSTSTAERRRILGVVFRIASGASSPVLEEFRDRLSDAGRADVESILRIVRYRESIGR